MSIETGADGVKVVITRDHLYHLLKRPVAFYPIFSVIAGGAKAGLFLSQAFYWDERTSDPDGWFYKKQTEWEEETTLNEEEQKTARRHLIKRKLLEEKRIGVPAKLHYRINKEKILEAIGEAIGANVLAAPQIPGKSESSSGESPNQDSGNGGSMPPTNSESLSTESTHESTSESTHTADARVEDKSSSLEAITTQLTAAGLSPRDAARLVAEVGADQCTRNLNPPGIGGAKNRVAYLKSAIRGDYAAGLTSELSQAAQGTPVAPVRELWQQEACERVYESLHPNAQKSADASSLGRYGYVERFHGEELKKAVAEMRQEGLIT
jgi:hypothetical protein